GDEADQHTPAAAAGVMQPANGNGQAGKDQREADETYDGVAQPETTAISHQGGPDDAEHDRQRNNKDDVPEHVHPVLSAWRPAAEIRVLLRHDVDELVHHSTPPWAPDRDGEPALVMPVRARIWYSSRSVAAVSYGTSGKIGTEL